MISGIVKSVIERPWGNKTMYSVAVIDQDGLFGFGSWNPRVVPGDKVEFQASKNPKGFWQADKDTLKVEAGKEEVVSNVTTRAIAAGSVKGKDTYWADKEARDVGNDGKRETGASRNTAIEWIKFLVTQGAFPKLPPSSKLEDFYNNLLADYMNKFMGITGPKTGPAKAAKTTEADKEDQSDKDWS